MPTPDSRMTVLRAAALARWLHPRPPGSHKGDNGHVLCVGGDHGSGGAIVLCAQAALRAGAGLVSVATRAAHVPALVARQPEAMAHAVESGEAFEPLLGRADVVAIGPGLGRGEWGRALLLASLRAGKPLVLDADALNLLAGMAVDLPADAILTPHPGEAGRLLGCDAARVQSDRAGATSAAAASWCSRVRARWLRRPGWRPAAWMRGIPAWPSVAWATC